MSAYANIKLNEGALQNTQQSNLNTRPFNSMMEETWGTNENKFIICMSSVEP